MHGLRHAPGSNQVCVSFLGVFAFSFVIFVGALAFLFVIRKMDFAVKQRDITALSRSFPFGLYPLLSKSRSFFRGLYPRLRNLSAKVIIILQTPAKKANNY